MNGENDLFDKVTTNTGRILRFKELVTNNGDVSSWLCVVFESEPPLLGGPKPLKRESKEFLEIQKLGVKYLCEKTGHDLRCYFLSGFRNDQLVFEESIDPSRKMMCQSIEFGDAKTYANGFWIYVNYKVSGFCSNGITQIVEGSYDWDYLNWLVNTHLVDLSKRGLFPKELDPDEYYLDLVVLPYINSAIRLKHRKTVTV